MKVTGESQPSRRPRNSLMNSIQGLQVWAAALRAPRSTGDPTPCQPQQARLARMSTSTEDVHKEKTACPKHQHARGLSLQRPPLGLCCSWSHRAQGLPWRALGSQHSVVEGRACVAISARTPHLPGEESVKYKLRRNFISSFQLQGEPGWKSSRHTDSA